MVWFHKHSNNETIVGILIFVVFFFFGFEVVCFIIIAEKDKNKVLKFGIMYLPYLEISAPSFKHCPLISKAPARFKIK